MALSPVGVDPSAARVGAAADHDAALSLANGNTPSLAQPPTPRRAQLLTSTSTSANSMAIDDGDVDAGDACMHEHDAPTAVSSDRRARHDPGPPLDPGPCRRLEFIISPDSADAAPRATGHGAIELATSPPSPVLTYAGGASADDGDAAHEQHGAAQHIAAAPSSSASGFSSGSFPAPSASASLHAPDARANGDCKRGRDGPTATVTATAAASPTENAVHAPALAVGAGSSSALKHSPLQMDMAAPATDASKAKDGHVIDGSGLELDVNEHHEDAHAYLHASADSAASDGCRMASPTARLPASITLAIVSSLREQPMQAADPFRIARTGSRVDHKPIDGSCRPEPHTPSPPSPTDFTPLRTPPPLKQGGHSGPTAPSQCGACGMDAPP